MVCKSNFSERRITAQGALEYLLILVAAIIVVAIVVIFISGFTNTASQGGQDSQGTILDSFNNWGNMLGGNTQGTTPPAPTSCAELGKAGTLTIEGQTVFCDNDGKMWTPTSEINYYTGNEMDYCNNFGVFDNWRIPTLAEHQTFRVSLGNEYCPVTENCIATPAWDQYGDYTNTRSCSDTGAGSCVKIYDSIYYKINNNTVSSYYRSKVRCIRDE